MLAAAVGGCHSVGPLVKRDSELNCPTDIRRTVPWCAGEDAIFHCPCGPDGEYYGHKPTCWRTWPAPATVWRDSYCGVQGPCAVGPTAVPQEETPIVLPPTDEATPPSEETVEPPVLEALPPTSQTSPGRGRARLASVVQPPTWMPSSAEQSAELAPRMTSTANPSERLTPRPLAPRRDMPRTAISNNDDQVVRTSYSPALPQPASKPRSSPTPRPLNASGDNAERDGSPPEIATSLSIVGQVHVSDREGEATSTSVAGEDARTAETTSPTSTNSAGVQALWQFVR